MNNLIIEDFFLDTINLKAFCDLKIEPIKPEAKFEKGKVTCAKIEFKLSSQYSRSEYDRLFGEGDLRLSWKLKPVDEPDKIETIAVRESTTVELSGSTLTFKPKNKEKKFVINLLEHSLYGEYKLGCLLDHSISYADGPERQLLKNANMADLKSGIEFTIKGTEKKIGSKLEIICNLANDKMKELFKKEYKLKVYFQEYIDKKQINNKDESDKIVIDISEKISKEGKISFDWYLGMDMDSSHLDSAKSKNQIEPDEMVFSYPRIGKSSLFNYNCVLKLYKLKSEKSKVYVPYKTISSATGDVALLKDIKKPVFKDFIVKKANEKKSYYDGLVISGKIGELAKSISKINLNFGFYAVDHLGYFHNIKRNELVTVKLDGKDGSFKCEVKPDEDDGKIAQHYHMIRTFRYFGAISIANAFIVGDGRVRSIFYFSPYYRALTDYNGLLSDYKKIIKDSGVEKILYYGFKSDAGSYSAAKEKIVEIMDKGVSWTPDPNKKKDPFTTLMLNAIYFTGNFYDYGQKTKITFKAYYNYFTGKYGYWHKGANYSYGSFLYSKCKESLQGMVAADIVEAFKPEVTDYSRHPVLKVTARGLLALLQAVYLKRYSVNNGTDLISFGITGDMICSANMSYKKQELLDIPEVENVLFYNFSDDDKKSAKVYYKRLLSDRNEKGFIPEVNKLNLKATVIMNAIYYLKILYDWEKCDGKSYYKTQNNHFDYYGGKSIYYSSHNISFAQFVFRHARDDFTNFVLEKDSPREGVEALVDRYAKEIYTTGNNSRRTKDNKVKKSWRELGGFPIKRNGFEALVMKVFEKVTS